MSSDIFDGQEPESLGEFDSVLIMADAKRESDPMHSDSNVLAALLLLKQQREAARAGNSPTVESSK